MKLYNTLTRKIEGIKPINYPLVTIYTCGPTVYDYSHIGHWFNYVRMDMLVRALKSSGLTTKWVMNITDVGHLVSDSDSGEDKLQKQANKENKSAWEIADFYAQDFLKGMRELNNLDPDIYTKATEHISDQIELIKILEYKGYVYFTDDGVYYDTSKFPRYKEFAKLNLDDSNEFARISPNKQKRQPWDFALWKFSPKHEKRDMEWDSPWGKGWPGWHIECSAMSMKYLGETLDIHTGGIDHIPTHHTNEIAQSEAATAKRYSNHWMHSNHVLVEGQKISKSLKNGITLEDIYKKDYTAEDLRTLILESNYRNQSSFSWNNLTSAKKRLNDYRAMAVLKFQAQDIPQTPLVASEITATISSMLQDDLNTPQVMSFLSQIAAKLSGELLSKSNLIQFESILKSIDNLLGLKLSQVSDINEVQISLIKKRLDARSNNDFKESDNIRDELKQQNIGLNDTKTGTIWYYLN